MIIHLVSIVLQYYPDLLTMKNVVMTDRGNDDKAMEMQALIGSVTKLLDDGTIHNRTTLYDIKKPTP